MVYLWKTLWMISISSHHWQQSNLLTILRILRMVITHITNYSIPPVTQVYHCLPAKLLLCHLNLISYNVVHPISQRRTGLCNIFIELRKNKLSPLDLVTKIVDNSNTKYDNYHIKMYEDSGRYKLERILNMIMNGIWGKVILLDWIRPHALQQVCKNVSNEMGVLTSPLHMMTNTITPDYPMTWTLQDNVEHVVSAKTPSLLSIIHAASHTKRSLKKNKKKDTLSVSLLTVLACLRCWLWPYIF